MRRCYYAAAFKFVLVLGEIMSYYSACPCCGHKLLKGEEGTSVEVPCRKCGRLICVQIADGKIITSYAEVGRSLKNGAGRSRTNSSGSFSSCNQ